MFPYHSRAKSEGQASDRTVAHKSSFEIGRKWIKQRFVGPKHPRNRLQKKTSGMDRTDVQSRRISHGSFDNRISSRRVSVMNSRGAGNRHSRHIQQPIWQSSQFDSLDSPAHDQSANLSFHGHHLSPPNQSTSDHPLAFVTQNFVDELSRGGSPAMGSTTSWTLGELSERQAFEWECAPDAPSSEESVEKSHTFTSLMPSARSSHHSPFRYDSHYLQSPTSTFGHQSSPKASIEDSTVDIIDRWSGNDSILSMVVPTKPLEKTDFLPGSPPLRLKPIQSLVIPPRKHIAHSLHVPFLHTRQGSGSSTATSASSMPETPPPQTPLDSNPRADVWNTLRVLRDGWDHTVSDSDSDSEDDPSIDDDMEDVMIGIKSLTSWEKRRGNYI